MTEPLLTISAFARAVDLPPSALRYYDQSGLLPPSDVDVQTGYRYYTPDLEQRAHMIRRMREVGVPIDTMRRVIDGPTDEAVQILNGFAARANERARRTTSAVDDIVACLRAGDAAPAGPTVISLDGPELASALRRVSLASSSEPDSALDVVLLDIDDTNLTVVATDRYWLAMRTMSLDDVQVGQRRVVLPVGAVDDLARWLARQETVTISATAENLRVAGSEDDYSLQASVDRFPAYRILLDTRPRARGRVVVNRAELLTAVSDAESPLLVRLSHDRMIIRTHGAADGVRLEAASSGEPITLGFSGSLLASALTAMVGTEVILSYVAKDHSVGLTSAAERSFSALVMPTKLDE